MTNNSQNTAQKIITNPEPTTVEAPVKNAAVIGAGSMGAGIAALLASSGINVTLLDMADDGETHEERSARAHKGIEIQKKRKGFVHPKFVENISAGNTTDNLDKLNECDWVVEAIFEDLDAKRSLYETIAPHLNDTALLSSNTSTIPLAELTAKLSDDLASRFAITHFFNPPRERRSAEAADAKTSKAKRPASRRSKCSTPPLNSSWARSSWTAAIPLALSPTVWVVSGWAPALNWP